MHPPEFCDFLLSGHLSSRIRSLISPEKRTDRKEETGRQLNPFIKVSLMLWRQHGFRASFWAICPLIPSETCQIFLSLNWTSFSNTQNEKLGWVAILWGNKAADIGQTGTHDALSCCSARFFFHCLCLLPQCTTTYKHNYLQAKCSVRLVSIKLSLSRWTAVGTALFMRTKWI